MDGGKFLNPRCAIVIAHEAGPLLENVATRLCRSGVVTEFLQAPLVEPAVAFDLVVLRNKSREVLCWAKRQQKRDSLVLPDPQRVGTIKDRRTCGDLMKSAGADLPESMVGTPSTLLNSGVEDLLPVVVKRRLLHGGRLRPIFTRQELAHEMRLYASGEELMAERYMVGKHYTAAFVAEDIFVFLRPAFALTSRYAEPVSRPSDSIIETVRKYRLVSGLNFGKIDVVVTASGKVFLVDCGVSPNLWLVPEADQLLANHLISQLRGRVNSVTRMELSDDRDPNVRFGQQQA